MKNREGGGKNMAIVKDPEGRETAALMVMVDFKDRSVLEIGCGAGG
jgi:hypothetical protein